MAETEQGASTGLRRMDQNAAPALRPGPSPMDRALELADRLRQRVMALPPGKRNTLIAFGLFLAAMAGGLAWYSSRTDWRTLFNGLEGKDIQQVSQELGAVSIPYQLTADGTGIQVPAAMLDKARMAVAAKGMPQSGRLGFELFDKPNWIGSEFDERVNYQRALEGELEHTIETLSAVRSARVHLVMAQHSLFSSEEKAAKASVVLKLKRVSLDQEQVESIRSLVAGAVENLSIEDVTLVDADGRTNLKPRSKDFREADIEQQMESKLVAMLEPLAGRDNVRATVSVSYDESTQDKTDEVYDPNQSAPLTLEKTEQTSATPGRAAGIPGTASNSPAGAPTGAAQGSQAASAPGTPPLLQKEALPVYPQQGSGGGQSIREETGTYGVTKHVLHVEERPGRVKRVTAAVVVNDRSVSEGTGKAEHVVWKPRSAEEMRRLEELAQAAIGFDHERGDHVVVENVSFNSNAPEVKPSAIERATAEVRNLLQGQPELGRVFAIGVCGILLVLYVMRPITRQMIAILGDPPSVTGGVQQARLTGPVLEQPHENSNGDDEPQRLKAPQPLPNALAAQQRQGVFDQVAEHIRREPVQSTRLLEAWIGATEEED